MSLAGSSIPRTTDEAVPTRRISASGARVRMATSEPSSRARLSVTFRDDIDRARNSAPGQPCSVAGAQ